MFSIQKISSFKSFVAIDFETANRFRNSACAVGLIKVENSKIIKKKSIYIRPVSTFFEFTNIHGITWEMVKNKPTFEEAWPEIESFIQNADFLAAHNSMFDKKILNACCHEYNIPQPDLPFICTVKLARETWRLYPTKLPDVCRFLNISLKHHDPLSDAEACAKIVISAIEYANNNLNQT